MKIALCLSCQPRFVERTFQNIYTNLIEGYDVDVFIHSWIDEEKPYEFRPDGIWANVNQTPNIGQVILDMYKPKRHLFEKPKFFKPSKIIGMDPCDCFRPLWVKRCAHMNTPKTSEYFINMIHCMWYSIMMSNLQKELYRLETGTDYDLVVRTRFDVTFRQKIRYEQLSPDIMYAMSQVHGDHIHDFCSISGTRNMNVYCSLFNNLEYHLSRVSPDWRCGEGLLHSIMKTHGIPCAGMDIIDIVRP